MKPLENDCLGQKASVPVLGALVSVFQIFQIRATEKSLKQSPSNEK